MNNNVAGLRAFIAEMPEDAIFTDSAVTTLYSYDATNVFFFHDAVVRPQNSEQLGQIVKVANRTGVPLTPRGAGTGFSGGSLPAEGGVVIDFMGMNQIVDFDFENMMVKVQAGVITNDLAAVAAKHGLYYPPDPASLKTCTIGGNVAENAGGPRCLKYGVTRDYVLGIDGFTGDGRGFSFGRGVLKNRAGYDMKQVLIGSEGTLAVFSDLFLRLVPMPEAKTLFTAFFKDFRDATSLVNRIMLKGIAPSSLEFMDEFAIRAVENHAGMGLPTGYQALLIVEIDGRHDEMPVLKKVTQELLEEAAAEIRCAETPARQDELWEIRRQASPAMRAYGNKKANEDIAVPRKHVPLAVEKIREIAQKNSLNIINFGHIGDGNIHVNVMYDKDDAAEAKRVEVAIREIFDLVNSLGGAVSGEHGIGISKKRFLPGNIDPVSYDLMRSMKKLFDPNNIMNPFKMFY